MFASRYGWAGARLAAILLAGTLGTTAQAATIANASFELPGTFSGGFTQINAGNPAIDGWTVESGSVDLINTYWQNADGNYSLDLSGGSAGSIYQDITGLSAGASYRVSFALAGNPDSGPSAKQLQVSAGGASQTFVFDTSGKSRESMGWVTQLFDFVATATTERLTFTSLTAGAYGPALDNIGISRTSDQPAVIPVPAAGPLLLGALALVGFVGRRRRG